VKFRFQEKELGNYLELGKYSCRMVVYVAKIGENCILGTDFCLQTGIDEVFRSLNLHKKRNQNTFSVGFLLLRRKFQMGVGNSTRFSGNGYISKGYFCLYL